MDVTGICEDGTLTVYLTGELDHHAARGAMREIGRLIDENLPRSCCLALSGLQFMDSSGIAVVLSTWRHMQRLGGTACVADVPKQAARVLCMAGVPALVPGVKME